MPKMCREWFAMSGCRPTWSALRTHLDAGSADVSRLSNKKPDWVEHTRHRVLKKHRCAVQGTKHQRLRAMTGPTNRP